jgi:tetratricopeptide (TPR) repeat protein
VAQLIDARTGINVWAERFDRTGTDPWMLQDEIASKIMVALTGDYGQLKRAQYHEAWGADSTNLGEYDYYLRGHEFYMRFTTEDNERAGEIWRKGLTDFPGSALLQAKLGWHHFLRPYLFFTGEPAVEYARAGELVRGALARPHLSPLEGRVAHWLFAYVSTQEGEYERALREMDTTLALSPYDAFASGDLSTVLILAGKTDEAIAATDKSIAADPVNAAYYKQLKGWALTVAGRHAEAAAVLKESIELPAVPLLQAINYARLGRPEDARTAVERGMKLTPSMSLARWRSANFYRDRAILEAQVADLTAAGLR